MGFNVGQSETPTSPISSVMMRLPGHVEGSSKRESTDCVVPLECLGKSLPPYMATLVRSRWIGSGDVSP